MSCPFISPNAFWSKDETVLKSSCWLIRKDGHWWKWEPPMDKNMAPNAINTSPRFLRIWLGGHVGRSLTKPGHAHVMTSATATFEAPKKTHNKNISENSPYIFRINYGTQKECNVIICTTEASNWKLYKTLKCLTAPNKISMLKVQRSEKHNFDINRCDAEKQKKNIAANWVAPPVTLTGDSGNLREHIHRALVKCVCICVCPCAIYFRL